MKHRVKKGPKFSRDKDHRQLMLRNLVTSLILHEKIKTTVTKGKETARLVDRLILIGRKDPLLARRHLNSFLLDKNATNKIIDVVASAEPDRVSGFVQMAKLPNRLGDNAPMIQLDLILPVSLKNAKKDQNNKTSVKTRVIKKEKVKNQGLTNKSKQGFLNKFRSVDSGNKIKTTTATRTTNK